MSAPRSPHALILPYPAQGHITPLMELSHCLADRGVRITFINTHFNHRLIFSTLPPGHAELAGGGEIDGIHFVAIPDGLEPGEDRHDLGRLTQSLAEVMPSFLEELMRRNDDAGFTCFIADVNMAWALKIAKSAGLRTAAFWPAAAGFLVAMFSIPELIRDGVIDEDGSAVKKEVIQVNPKLSPMDTSNLPWQIFNDAQTQKIIFKYIFANCEAATCDADMIACNSFEKLEEAVLDEAPYNILPIGPLLLPNNSRGDPNLCHFWPSDKHAASTLRYLRGFWQHRCLQQWAIPRAGTWPRAHRPAILMVGAARSHEQARRLSLRLRRKSRRSRANGCLVPSTEGFGASCDCVLRIALWLELDNGRSEKWSAFSVLALLWRSAVQPGLHN